MEALPVNQSKNRLKNSFYPRAFNIFSFFFAPNLNAAKYLNFAKEEILILIPS